MSLRVENKVEIKIAGLNDHDPRLQDVVELLNSLLPNQSSVIVQIASANLVSDGIPRLLQGSDELKGLSGTGKPRFTAPKTWLVGGFDDCYSQPSTWGLFLSHKETYDVDHTRAALGATIVDHQGLDTETLTGRSPKEISPILPKGCLEACSVINFEPPLIKYLKPDRCVSFPLGNGYFYCANARQFLTGYARLLSIYGVRTNIFTLR